MSEIKSFRQFNHIVTWTAATDHRRRGGGWVGGEGVVVVLINFQSYSKTPLYLFLATTLQTLNNITEFSVINLDKTTAANKDSLINRPSDPTRGEAPNFIISSFMLL